MKKLCTVVLVFTLLFLLLDFDFPKAASNDIFKIKMVKEANQYDVFKYPRPGVNTTNVPLNTSFFIRLYIPSNLNDTIDRNSVEIQLQESNKNPIYILNKGLKAAEGYKCTTTYGDHANYGKILDIYIDSTVKLNPSTKYTVKVTAETRNNGYKISDTDGSWSFTTERIIDKHQINYSLDLTSDPHVNWKGQFFSGLLKPDFCTTGVYGTDRFDYIFSDKIKKKYPRAWNLFRDFRVTGSDYYDTGILPSYQPNVVREKETRRVTKVDYLNDGALLKVEDFFGHEQYGIESNRPLTEDYHAGDEILISDGVNYRKATVISVNDKDKTVKVSKFTNPNGGWKLDYLSPLPTNEDPQAPGLFPKGGTYLYKFNPSGTPVYYWGRLDYHMDKMHTEYGQRLVVGFCEAPADLSIDGRDWTYAKDYVELHKVTYDITSHLIDRYGDATLDWVWSMLNEPDLWSAFWRSNDWIELQRFYDYSSDAILKAFEDKGYDSNKVFIGGLELGAVFGPNLRVDEFLIHCSPTATRDGVLLENAAYADPRLDGKRSKRVEELCSKNNGMGAPLDFISIHTYNNSKTAAQKIIKAKEVALSIDPEYYKDLWINNFESVPTWHGFEDPGASEWTLGNGYFPTWTTDFIGKQLQKAKEDSRYAYGESIYTIWGFSSTNFGYLNDIITEISIGDKAKERTEIIPKPIFHLTNLLSTMGSDYWVFPEEKVGGHVVSGFASPTDEDVRLVLYSHNTEDLQCRSESNYNIKLDLKGLKWDEVMVTQYQFDSNNNTYYQYAVNNKSKKLFTEDEFKEIKDLSTLKVTDNTIYNIGGNGNLTIELPVKGNGINFVVIGEPRELEEPTEPDNDETKGNNDETNGDNDETKGNNDETNGDNDGTRGHDDNDETKADGDDETKDDKSKDKGKKSEDDTPTTYDKGIIGFILAIMLTAVISTFFVVKKVKMKVK